MKKTSLLFILLISILAFGCNRIDDPEMDEVTTHKSKSLNNELDADSAKIIYNFSLSKLKSQVKDVYRILSQATGIESNQKIVTGYDLMIYCRSLPANFIITQYNHYYPDTEKDPVALYEQLINELIQLTSQEEVDYLESFVEDYVAQGGNNIDYLISSIKTHPRIIQERIVLIAALVDCYNFPKNTSLISKVSGDYCSIEAIKQVLGDIPMDILDAVGLTILTIGEPALGLWTDGLVSSSKLIKITHAYNICVATKWY